MNDSGSARSVPAVSCADSVRNATIPSLPRWTPPRRSSLRWFQVASGWNMSANAARSPLANASKPARTTSTSVMVAVLVVAVLAVMDGSFAESLAIAARNRRQRAPPAAIDCSVDLGRGGWAGLAARPCRIANIARPARVETPHLA